MAQGPSEAYLQEHSAYDAYISEVFRESVTVSPRSTSQV